MKHGSTRDLTRRDVLLAIAATASAGVSPATAYAKTVMSLGGKKLRTVSDGNLVLPISFLLPDVPEAERMAIFEEHGLDAEQLAPECNLTLLEDGDRRILFDAGSGVNFMPSAGKLPETLEAAGIAADTITDVVFTHGHPDHLWGILDDFDEIAFPEATLRFPRAEWDFWRSDSVIDRMPEGRQAFAVGAQNRLAAMEDQVELFDAGQEVAPGVEAVDTSGHTPGHTSFAVHGGGDSVMIIGDAVTNHVYSFARPEWPSGSDQDTQAGIQTRLKLLDRLATDNSTIIGFHLPNGGVGRTERDGTAYRFVQDK